MFVFNPVLAAQFSLCDLGSLILVVESFHSLTSFFHLATCYSNIMFSESSVNVQTQL